MRGTLVLCALAVAQAKQVPDWVSKLRAQPPYNDYNECEWFIGTIYNEIVDDAFDAPSVTLARRPVLTSTRSPTSPTSPPITDLPLRPWPTSPPWRRPAFSRS